MLRISAGRDHEIVTIILLYRLFGELDGSVWSSRPRRPLDVIWYSRVLSFRVYLQQQLYSHWLERSSVSRTTMLAAPGVDQWHDVVCAWNCTSQHLENLRSAF